MVRARAALRDLASGAARRAATWSNDELANGSAVDLVIAAALSRQPVAELNDGAAYVQFLRAAWGRLTVTCTDVGPTNAAPATAAELRFDTLARTLQEGVPAWDVASALRLAAANDGLAGRREEFTRPRYATDVSQHAALASSGASKGRLLSALVRFMRARQVVDIGTAYGLSALYLAQELPAEGRIVTIEISQPQLSVSAEVLAPENRIHRIAGASQDVVEHVRKELGVVDLLCHDGEHSRAAYGRDFEAYLSLMPAGSVWFLDDIRWEDERVSDHADTYAGWMDIRQHARVRRALELDNGSFGLLQLR